MLEPVWLRSLTRHRLASQEGQGERSAKVGYTLSERAALNVSVEPSPAVSI